MVAELSMVLKHCEAQQPVKLCLHIADMSSELCFKVPTSLRKDVESGGAAAKLLWKPVKPVSFFFFFF